MCGIVVIFSKQGPVDTAVSEKALKSLYHRGPDLHFGMSFFDGRLFIGQTVLSITGNPNTDFVNYHTSRSGRHHIVFNGEIYNFKKLSQHIPDANRFQTKTDTEVLVNLYDHIPHQNINDILEGMYAFTVFDEAELTLNVVRDLIGEKIMYTYEDDKMLIIASEVKTILSVVGEVSLNAAFLKNYFFTRHLLTFEDTPYSGITAIPPGATWQYDLKKEQFTQKHQLGIESLINLDQLEDNQNRSFDDIVNECDSIFHENARHLMPTIDYASVFSGGVDSSLASHYMLSQPNKPQLVALSFPGKDDISTNLDLFARKMNTPIDVVEVSTDLFKDALNSTYEHTMLPVSTHSFPSQKILAQRVNELGLKVLIGGDGADELFGGYEAYKALSTDYKNPSPYTNFIDHGFSFDAYDASAYQHKLHDNWLSARACYDECDQEEAMLQSVLLLDSRLQLEAVGLRASDLLSMAHSVEGRGFFITKPILKFILNIPARHKINMQEPQDLFKTKPILKTLFTRKFGDELLFNKQGFSGYPNEAGRRIAGSDFRRLKSILKSRALEHYPNIAMEWKMLNIEMFLIHT